VFIVDEVCDHLCYYVERSGKFLPTFRDKISVTFSKVNKHKNLNLENGSRYLGFTIEANL